MSVTNLHWPLIDRGLHEQHQATSFEAFNQQKPHGNGLDL